MDPDADFNDRSADTNANKSNVSQPEFASPRGPTVAKQGRGRRKSTGAKLGLPDSVKLDALSDLKVADATPQTATGRRSLVIPTFLLTHKPANRVFQQESLEKDAMLTRTPYVHTQSSPQDIGVRIEPVDQSQRLSNDHVDGSDSKKRLSIRTPQTDQNGTSDESFERSSVSRPGTRRSTVVWSDGIQPLPVKHRQSEHEVVWLDPEEVPFDDKDMNSFEPDSQASFSTIELPPEHQRHIPSIRVSMATQ